MHSGQLLQKSHFKKIRPLKISSLKIFIRNAARDIIYISCISVTNSTTYPTPFYYNASINELFTYQTTLMNILPFNAGTKSQIFRKPKRVYFPKNM